MISTPALQAQLCEPDVLVQAGPMIAAASDLRRTDNGWNATWVHIDPDDAGRRFIHLAGFDRGGGIVDNRVVDDFLQPLQGGVPMAPLALAPDRSLLSAWFDPIDPGLQPPRGHRRTLASERPFP